MKTRLPIGIQTFRKVREGGYRYVDKTPWARQMVNEGDCFFLSRPRRFGKSLFLSMLGELFRGSEELFEGLAIHPHWNWSESHPVLRLSFGSGNFKDPDRAVGTASKQLASAERQAGVTSAFTDPSDRLGELLEILHAKTRRKVLVLVDEYDKPIVDALEVPEVVRANRDFLRNFYGTLGACDEHVRFAFFTGVSCLTRDVVFPDLDGLIDLTLDPSYWGICGFTEADVDETFGEEVEGLDRERIRETYLGYGWLRGERLYNPWDILLLLGEREYKPHWDGSGGPAFAVETMLKHRVVSYEMEDRLVDPARLPRFDVDDIDPDALLFQTGYLTILRTQEDAGQTRFRLGYPNQAVRRRFYGHFLAYITRYESSRISGCYRLGELLEAHDFDVLREACEAFLARPPEERLTADEIARIDGYYPSVLHAYCACAHLDVTVEGIPSPGSLDMTVHHAGQVFLFALRPVAPPSDAPGPPSDAPDQTAPGPGTADGSAGAADRAVLADLKDRGYPDRYRHLGGSIHLIGIDFDTRTRKIVTFDTESIPAEPPAAA